MAGLCPAWWGPARGACGGPGIAGGAAWHHFAVTDRRPHPDSREPPPPSVAKPLPSVAQIDALLALGARMDPEQPYADRPPIGPWPDYAEPVAAFFREAGRPWWSDHGYRPEVEGARLRDPEALAAASLAELRSMLTYCVRSERFGDGAWGSLVQHGQVHAWLARLAELRAGIAPRDADPSP